MKKLLITLIGAATVLVIDAKATLITFDDVSVSTLAGIQPGYAGLNWKNMYILNETFRPNTGFVPGTVSGVNSAFNANNTPADILATAGNQFTLNSAYFTSAYAPAESLQVDGYRSGVKVYSTTVTMSPTLATQVFFNWLNVDDVKFTTIGSSFMVLDNLVVNEPVGGLRQNMPTTAVPEPSTWVSGAGFALLALGSLVRKLRR